jgi:beta-RFAP synthase
LVSVTRSSTGTIECIGADTERATAFAHLFCRFHGLASDARIHVHRALPRHAGLGSGTQLALAIARGLAEHHGLDPDVTQLARAVGRTGRSAVGAWVFEGGGLVVEGGRRAPDAPAPLLARIAFPATWCCVVAVPDTAPGISGAAEHAAFSELPIPPEGDAERVAHRVLMALLPALVEGDLPRFGAALADIQETTGRWFAPVQGGTFAPGPTEDLVRQLRAWGAHGVGQSSWGPTVYGIVEGSEVAEELAQRVRATLDGRVSVYEGPFRSEGARVWHGSRPD